MTATKTFTYEAIDATGALRQGQDRVATRPTPPRSRWRTSGWSRCRSPGPAPACSKELKIPGLRRPDDAEGPADLLAPVRHDDLVRADPAALAGDPRGADRRSRSCKAAIGEVRARRRRAARRCRRRWPQHPEHFPLLMVTMIRAGETGGFLDDALSRIAKMYEADANLRAKIKSAMTYPVIVLIFSLLLGTGVHHLHRPDLREDVQAARRQAAAADPDHGRRSSHNMVWLAAAAHRRSSSAALKLVPQGAADERRRSG